ncbi:hypothetical protein C8R44DRAFT_885688 [Mycena epipterygia]|nr:hypothetical protein C8R44DRAFT_885688 [Mycena epipterygia]
MKFDTLLSLAVFYFATLTASAPASVSGDITIHTGITIQASEEELFDAHILSHYPGLLMDPEASVQCVTVCYAHYMCSLSCPERPRCHGDMNTGGVCGA